MPYCNPRLGKCWCKLTDVTCGGLVLASAAEPAATAAMVARAASIVVLAAAAAAGRPQRQLPAAYVASLTSPRSER